MRKTKVFRSGNSQAVILPKGFQVHSAEVEIFKRGKEIVIREIPKTLKGAFDLLTSLPDDFLIERKDELPQK